MALAWSYRYFLLSFTRSSLLRRLIGVLARLTSFYLTYLDYLLINKAGTLDAASGYYFIGRKSNRVLPDRDLIKLYNSRFAHFLGQKIHCLARLGPKNDDKTEFFP